MVCFVGSTIVEDVETLKILGKKLKKNAVAVDLVVFGDVSEEQTAKANAFIATVQNEDNSHCVVIQPGDNLSDKLLSSPIFGGNGVAPGAAGNLEEEDPELAAAIRMSLMENQPAQPPAQPSQPAAQPAAADREPTEEELEQLAIQMSL